MNSASFLITTLTNTLLQKLKLVISIFSSRWVLLVMGVFFSWSSKTTRARIFFAGIVNDENVMNTKTRGGDPSIITKLAKTNNLYLGQEYFDLCKDPKCPRYKLNLFLRYTNKNSCIFKDHYSLSLPIVLQDHHHQKKTNQIIDQQWWSCEARQTIHSFQL